MSRSHLNIRSYNQLTLSSSYEVPPAEEARKRLIAKIGSLPIVQHRAIRGTSAFLLYFSYAWIEKDLISQLEQIGKTFQYLFGVMGDIEGSGTGVEAFEALFNHPCTNGTIENDSSEDSECEPETTNPDMRG